MAQPYIQKAVDWLKMRQRDDGGWGEDCATYWAHRKNAVKDSMPSQTAWALLGLMAAGEIQSVEATRGIQYLLDQFDSIRRLGRYILQRRWLSSGFLSQVSRV